MYTLLSLFDESGQWSDPYREGGWEVIQWDIKLLDFMDIMHFDSVETVLDLFYNVDGILAAPPCTHFSFSGAQYWPAKDADGRTATAVEYVRQVIRLADLFTPTDPECGIDFFWSMENPVGRMGKLLGLDAPWYFHPYEFAGYLPLSSDDLARLDHIRAKHGIGVTSEESDFVVSCNAYTKKTGLWGSFSKPVKKPIAPVKCAPQGSFTQRYGGKSEATKEARSVTPAGFAQAFYQFNNFFKPKQ